MGSGGGADAEDLPTLTPKSSFAYLRPIVRVSLPRKPLLVAYCKCMVLVSMPVHGQFNLSASSSGSPVALVPNEPVLKLTTG